MNINLINDLNLTSSRQSELVETDVMANDNDGFQQLLRLNENKTEQGKQTLNTKLDGTDNAHEENGNDVDIVITAIHPFNIATPEQTNLALIGSAQHSDTSIEQNSLLTANLHSDLLDNLLTEKPINEQATQLLSSIYDSENLINNVTSQNDVISLTNKKEAKSGLAHQQVSTIDDDINFNANPTSHKQYANNMMHKMATFQSQFITTNRNKDAIMNTNQDSFLTNNTNNGQSLLLSPTHASTTLATTSIHLPTQVNITQWQTSLAEQIIMFNRQSIQTAEIKLHPQELGALHIKLEMNDDKMNLHMMAAHHVVKGMLESALPFLKVSLEDQGITLEQANIGDFSMMNDSPQSAMHQQSQNNQSQKVISLDATDEHMEPILLEHRSLRTGLSVLA
ncbi:flagellar hook-length control protein FliK [Gilliamella sp. ESL0254]|uniref:flagellar hook-length control protein FliK n=1 Tax=Gilliamella sp. ESL0254 TaxID=2705035 RepID=UPI00158016F6|nr:flagellar hook-length control protein FliK [Gilliamella sp. ESL0254]NUF27917.1 flagellar hook-length control protein FliK [Gilliamella sp. ESL0254]